MTKGTSSICPEGPRVVMCSSAGVTRPLWSEDKKTRLVGAADIPIVRLNPLDILGSKRESENILRNSNVKYSIVRPCGLNDKWPEGRPLLSQGDVAVGRMCRSDVASLLVDMLFYKSAVGKTFEAISVPGYPRARSYSDQLSRLRDDTAQPLDDDALQLSYAILQQLVPGETLAPNQLAMGQTYEQLVRIIASIINIPCICTFVFLVVVLCVLLVMFCMCRMQESKAGSEKGVMKMLLSRGVLRLYPRISLCRTSLALPHFS